MTYAEARKLAEEIVNQYIEEGTDVPFPYELDNVYGEIPYSALSEEQEEVEGVIKAFTNHIMIYNSPLAKAMTENDN